VTRMPAYCAEQSGLQCYTFSVLGQDGPLFALSQPESDPTHIAGELNLPVPIRRLAFEEHPEAYYGADLSLAIWADGWAGAPADEPIPVTQLIPADLSGWTYVTPLNFVSVDVQLGRIAFSCRANCRAKACASVIVMASPPTWAAVSTRGRCHSSPPPAFSIASARGAISEYFSGPEPVAYGQASECDYRDRCQRRLCRAIEHHAGRRAVAADSCRQPYQARAAHAGLAYRSAGRAVRQAGLGQPIHARRSTDHRPTGTDRGRPGWRSQPSVSGRSGHPALHAGARLGESIAIANRPGRPTPSLQLNNVRARLCIAHSIVGSIQIQEDEVSLDPIPVDISDSIIDATDSSRRAVSAPGDIRAHAVLSVQRCTVFGIVDIHSVQLGENSIFTSCVNVARRQLGCMRFSYVPRGCRTPKRYHCQPDGVIAAVMAAISDPQKQRVELANEQLRVTPAVPRSVRYGTPAYAQLGDKLRR